MAFFPKLLRYIVTSRKLNSSPVAVRYAPYNSAQEDCRTKGHMEKLDRSLGSRMHPTLCLNLPKPVSTRRFTQVTSLRSVGRPLSRDILVIFLQNVIIRRRHPGENGSFIHREASRSCFDAYGNDILRNWYRFVLVGSHFCKFVQSSHA